MEAQSLGSRGSFSKSEGFSGSEVSDELDHVPLTRRRRILLANQQRSDSADCNGSENPFMFVTVEEEDERCNAQDILSLSPACSSRRVETLVQGQGQDSKCEDPGEVSTRELCNTVIESSARGDCSQHIKSRESDLPQSGNLDSSVFTSPHTSRVRDECAEDLLHLEESGIDRCFNSDAPITKIKDEVCNYIADDYMDHIVLKERQRMLLAGKLLGATKPVLEGGFEALPGVHLQKAVKENERIDVAGGETVAAKDNDKKQLSVRNSIESNSYEGKGVPGYADDKNVSSQSTTVKIKDEPQNDNELDEDEADHVFLGDRMKLQRSKDDSKLSMPNELLKNPFPFEEKYSPIMSEPAKAYSINRPRKRKKTATDSVESALEEDAPGLLQVLIAKGVLVDEIKLYGETENDEAIDESSSEDSFTELESVISKIFTRRQSFLKLAPIRYGKGARASYCLACLISLVEQTRYLQFRKWPAEWGWCRDLQSFIFVFERHNRIVLERPEYGYATYFFELVDSLPIEWQIKRLVTAMKFTSCSRISLIENKALSIGEDMTEGEAKVLIGYGWVPNSGLGTMLKYRGRVVHDRKNENDASEWRSKIGKLLMDGYNGGTVVATEIPENDMEYVDSPNTQIKVEI